MKISFKHVRRIGGISLEIALGGFLLAMLLNAWKTPESHASSAKGSPKLRVAPVNREALLPVQGTVACSITCPPSQTVANDANQCGAVVSYPTPTLSGECGAPFCSPASGSLFPVGTTTVTCTSLDNSIVGVNTNRCDTIFGLVSGNALVKFSAQAPGMAIGAPIAITGLQPGETILAIDFRPVDGQLYGLGSTSRLYIINTTTGAATVVGGSPFSTALSGSAFGFDFNPTVDRIRVVSDADQNIRLNPITGAVAGSDTNLAYAAGDPNSGQNPNNVGAAYTNNFAGATTTTLYGIDSTLDILVRQGGINVPPGTPSPNTGQLFTVGPLGVDTSDLVGFDISACNGTAYASLTNDGTARLYTIDLTTGMAVQIGSLPVSTITDIAVSFRVVTCSFTVTVNDTQPPTLTCPGSILAGTGITCPASQSVSSNFATPSAAAGTITDNCPLPPGTTATCTPPSGSPFPAGTTTVTCTATDAAGNTGSCTFTVNVFNACIQDDSNPGNVILFNTFTGEYRVCCNGVVQATGTGTVLQQGCDYTLQHYPGDRRVTAKWSSATFKGSGSLQKPAGTLKCSIADRDIRNNTCNCGP